MPNRILKESIRFSETIEELTPEEEVFFYRLLTCCDDYGRFDGRPAIILAACFPLKLRSITEKHIMQWLDKLSTVGLLWIYEVDGKRYLQVTTWDKHQQVRAKRSKYPQPPESSPKQVISYDINCNHAISTDCICPRESESESESESINTCASDDASVCTSDDQKLIEKLRSPFKSLKQQERFDAFWAAYPKKKSKGQAEKAWIKINPDDELLGVMLSSLERLKRSKDWLKDGGQFIPYPATWLNAKGWEDELPATRDSPTAQKNYDTEEDTIAKLKRMGVKLEPCKQKIS